MYGQIARMLARALAGSSSVLDVGCGSDSRLQYADFDGYKIGADAYAPALSPKFPLHHEYVRCSLPDIALPPKIVDACVCLDVIEHLPKAEGYKLLGQLERIARKTVIIATPHGFLPQPPTPDNPFQEHISGWEIEDFESRGYTVYGLSGYKPWRGMYGMIVGRPFPVYYTISKLTERYFETHPRRAFALFCVKDVTAA